MTTALPPPPKIKTPTAIRRWLGKVHLGTGSHSSPEQGGCVMEVVAYLQGQPWSDAPQCVSPAITSFMQSWNDSLPDDRRDMLKPLIPVVIDTRTNAADEKKRAWMATDWLARVFAPEWLDLAAEKSGSAAVAANLRGHAEALRAIDELTDDGVARAALPLIEAARKDSEAAESAARSAAWSAAWSAAESAADEALAPTVKKLQASAIELVERMGGGGTVMTLLLDPPPGVDRGDGEQRCRACGCTDWDACPGGCSWVEDDLCSRCEEEGRDAD